MVLKTHKKKPLHWLALHFPELEEVSRQAAKERLQRLANWCYQYSSQVSIAHQRNGLLLEVAASQSLFGSVDALTERILDGLKKLGCHPDSGSAPTPEAAHLAARQGMHIHSSGDIRKSIAVLGVEHLHLPATQIEILHKTGFRSIAEVLRLPRKALARRLGPVPGNYLDRLLGHRPDPCKVFRPADAFAGGLDIPETIHTQGLVFPLKRLLLELCGVLRARDRAIQTLKIKLQPAHCQRDRDTATIHLTLQQATRSETHLMMLIRERLEHLQLPCPIQHVYIQAAHFLPYQAVQQQLALETDALPATTDSHIIERLQARLGTDAIKGLKCRQDHRPEYSWSLREPGEPVACTRLPQRPLWLMPEPQHCQIDQYHILAGPERIESGWWDGKDCRRDYFVVRGPGGKTLWAFHEYKSRPGWYLHGLFA